MTRQEIIKDILSNLNEDEVYVNIIDHITKKVIDEFDYQAQKENFLSEEEKQEIMEYIKIDFLIKLREKINFRLSI